MRGTIESVSLTAKPRLFRVRWDTGSRTVHQGQGLRHIVEIAGAVNVPQPPPEPELVVEPAEMDVEAPQAAAPVAENLNAEESFADEETCDALGLVSISTL